MKNILIASSLSLMMASAASYANLPTTNAFNYKASKVYTVQVETAAELHDNMQSDVTRIDTSTNGEFTVAKGTLSSTIGFVYVSAPASAVQSFNSSEKSWVIDETKGVYDSGLVLHFEGVDEAIPGREINSGIPAYPVTNQFSIVAKKGKNLSTGEHAITFDYAVWVN